MSAYSITALLYISELSLVHACRILAIPAFAGLAGSTIARTLDLLIAMQFKVFQFS